MGYALEGSLLEVCTCEVLCPCWVNEPPDNGRCQGVLAWHVDEGRVNGTDVAGRTIALLIDVPGRILDGNWRAVVYVDDGGTGEQQQALLSLHRLRSAWMATRTARINAVRGILREGGVKVVR